MIVLDTNVVSEMMKSSPARDVSDWLAAQPPLEICVTAITRAEILYGIELLPAGKRRTVIAAAAETLFARRLITPVLAFDSDAAIVFAKVAAGRRRMGKPMDFMDAQIAAIALSRRAAIATRNSADFADCGVRIVNPWSSTSMR